MAKCIPSNVVIDALIETGIIRREDLVRRVVLDIRMGDIPVLYIERYGDDRVLQVVSALSETEIRLVQGGDAVAVTDAEVLP